MSQSDIVDAIRNIEGVDYVQLISPVEDIEMPDKCHYPVLDGQPVFDIVYSERAMSN